MSFIIIIALSLVVIGLTRLREKEREETRLRELVKELEAKIDELDEL